jgi:hypothetical protein
MTVLVFSRWTHRHRFLKEAELHWHLVHHSEPHLLQAANTCTQHVNAADRWYCCVVDTGEGVEAYSFSEHLSTFNKPYFVWSEIWGSISVNTAKVSWLDRQRRRLVQPFHHPSEYVEWPYHLIIIEEWVQYHVFIGDIHDLHWRHNNTVSTLQLCNTKITHFHFFHLFGWGSVHIPQQISRSFGWGSRRASRAFRRQAHRRV